MLIPKEHQRFSAGHLITKLSGLSAGQVFGAPKMQGL
jgi:hypothetical protein